MYMRARIHTHTHTHTRHTGSQILYFWLVYDMMAAILVNPFGNPKQYIRWYIGSAIFFGLLSAAILVGANGTQFREVGLVMPLLLVAFTCKHHTLPLAMSLNHHLVPADSRVPDCRVLTCAGLRSKGR